MVDSRRPLNNPRNNDVEELLRRSRKKKQITLIGHSLGARLIYNSLSIMEKNLVNTIYLAGGAVGSRAQWHRRLTKVDRVVKCYSLNDSVLKYLYHKEPIHLLMKTETSEQNDNVSPG